MLSRMHARTHAHMHACVHASAASRQGGVCRCGGGAFYSCRRLACAHACVWGGTASRPGRGGRCYSHEDRAGGERLNPKTLKP